MNPRRRNQLCALLVLSFCVTRPALSQSPDLTVPPDDPVRQAITRSLPYLESAGVAWMNGKKCVSCHRVSFLTWSFNEAARHGFDVDQPKLTEWVQWSVEKSLTSPAEGKPVDGEANADGLAQMILAHHAARPVALEPQQSTEFVRLLLKTQLEDGSWKPAGQLPSQKRPAAETAQVSTMWNVLALHSTGVDSAVDESCRRALSWLDGAVSETSAPVPTSTEWYAVRLLLSCSDSERAEAIPELTESLRVLQKPDGGWGWLTDHPSDALATGMALYALSTAGVPADDPALRSALQFLTTTQSEDGSWPVHGTKEKKKASVEETATYWGTAWATIGLLRTLPEPVSDAVTGPT